jgi:hypothetical protein
MAIKKGLFPLIAGIVVARPAGAATIPMAPPANYRLELESCCGFSDKPETASRDGTGDYGAAASAGPGFAAVALITRYHFLLEWSKRPYTNASIF